MVYFPKDWGKTFVWNVRKSSPSYTASYPMNEIKGITNVKIQAGKKRRADR